MPKVSILSSSYNHERYATEAIRSVLSQTFQDFEFVIVDDASLDTTVEKIRQFNDARINLSVHEYNQGMSATFGDCFKSCRGLCLGTG